MARSVLYHRSYGSQGQILEHELYCSGCALPSPTDTNPSSDNADINTCPEYNGFDSTNMFTLSVFRYFHTYFSASNIDKSLTLTDSTKKQCAAVHNFSLSSNSTPYNLRFLPFDTSEEGEAVVS